MDLFSAKFECLKRGYGRDSTHLQPVFAFQELLRELVLKELECQLAMAVNAEMPFRFLVEKMLYTNTSAID
jgi:hypothetical protein